MKKAIVALVAVFALSAGALLLTVHKQPVQAVPVAQVKPQPPTRAELLKLVNQERGKYGVAPLKEDARLDKSAQMKADDEVKYNYFGHISPVTNTPNFIGYIDQTGIYCKTDSENLAWVTNGSLETAQASVSWWMSSAPHRSALLSDKYTLTGFGISHSGIVEHFCQQ